MDPQLIKGLAYDIDETLSNSVLHYVTKLQERFGNPENLTPAQVIAKYRYTQHVPYWQTEDARSWQKKIIEDNEIQKEMPIIEDALEYVQKIHKMIPTACYLTIRPDCVKDGTLYWLQKHGFPDAPIITKPISVKNGHLWKAQTLEKNQARLIGLVDDNPKILPYLKNYRGTVFLYNNANVADSGTKTVLCKDWKSVYQAVKSLQHGKS